MKLLFFLLAIGVFIPNCISSSQRGYVKKKVTPPVESDSNTLILGKKIKIYSKSLNKEMSYWVNLPKSYKDQSILPKRYPVLYLLDGESHFKFSCGVVSFMSEAGAYNNYQIPELIVIAIPNKKFEDRDSLYTPTKVEEYDEKSGNGIKFLKFLREELIPQVDINYRTTGPNILSGHSLGGLLAAYDFLEESPIFNAHISMDPSLWWDDKLILKQAKERIAEKSLKGSLYLSLPKPKHASKQITMELAKILKESALEGLRSKLDIFETETHGSVPLLSLYNGLLFLFEGYKPSNWDLLIEEPSKIEPHFKKISKNFGIEFSPPEDLMYKICSHVKGKKAIECFKINSTNYPKSYNAHNALADAYLKNGDSESAKSHFEKSLSLNSSNNIAKEALEKLKSK
jgi:predicted alpha/beta superfamily hydrolase